MKFVKQSKENYKNTEILMIEVEHSSFAIQANLHNAFALFFNNISGFELHSNPILIKDKITRFRHVFILVCLYNTVVLSVISELQWSLICNKSVLKPLFQTIYAIGALLGCMSGGALSDK